MNLKNMSRKHLPNPEKYDLPSEGSEAEAEMLARLEDLFVNYTYENLSKNVTKVYAEEFYFRDAFKQFSNGEDLRDYLLHGLKPLDGRF